MAKNFETDFYQKDILFDSLLLHEANMFEQEFFRYLSSSSIGDIAEYNQQTSIREP
ncbi:hypothetical protein SAMN04487995_0357 [Dyadobacter koreensis]|uniref:Uncharacterized protein n=1 Tax=Dyadobacter koreensis TaxID=408657 RepID=A0A1H6QJK4_9BACT|nr:hypothetical protein [Dyadobacter koreensis]SEI39455.1 hypothetical protein SAMN04487995_0357 [Dyadobacter koreensis]